MDHADRRKAPIGETLTRKQRNAAILEAWAKHVGKMPNDGEQTLYNLAGTFGLAPVLQAIEEKAHQRDPLGSVEASLRGKPEPIPPPPPLKPEERQRRIVEDIARMRTLPVEKLIRWRDNIRARHVGRPSARDQERIQRMELVIAELLARGD